MMSGVSEIVHGYELASVATVAFLLVVSIVKSHVLQYFGEHRLVLPCVGFSALLLYILYANNILFVPGFIAGLAFVYKIAVAIAVAFAIVHYFNAHPVAWLQTFLHIYRTPLLAVLIFVLAASLCVTVVIASDYYAMDVLRFVRPFIQVFICGTVLVFLSMLLLRKLEENVVVINYVEIAIYFLVLVFFLWMAVSAMISIGFVHDFIVTKLNHARCLPLRYMIVFYSIFGFVIFTFSFFIYVMASRIVRTIFTIIVKYLRGQYQYHIINFVYGEEGCEDAQISFQFLARHARFSHFRRRIILRELMFLHKSLSGSITGKSKALYYDLGLQGESLHSLKRGSWPQKIRAVVELSYMDNQEALPGIILQLQSKNEMLRTEGQIALVKYDKTAETLLFLKTYRNYLTVYEQIHILYVLGRNKMRGVTLAPLLEAENPTVVAFALKLIGVFEQVGNFDNVLPFLRHHQPFVCEAAIQALGNLGLPQGAQSLMGAYDHQTYQNKLVLLDAIAQIPVKECRGWLRDIIESSSDHAIRLAACRALKATEYPGENIFEMLFEHPADDIARIMRHVNDKRI